jgi:hypothetical protein
MVSTEDRRIRLGIVEHRYACRTCGRAITTFNRTGYLVWAGMVAALVGMTAWGFAAGKVKRGDGTGIVVFMAVLVGIAAILAGRALLADRRNPPVEPDGDPPA